jgi:hypothetical protein
MGEVVSGQSAPFYLTKASARSRGSRRHCRHFQMTNENPFIVSPIIKLDR